MSSGARKDIDPGKFNPSYTFSTLKLGSYTKGSENEKRESIPIYNKEIKQKRRPIYNFNSKVVFLFHINTYFKIFYYLLCGSNLLWSF
jgi:hypothetical protein